MILTSASTHTGGRKIKYISLFSGIGGFDLGFDRAGMECVLQVEKDEKARAVLTHHWPNVPKMELVENVTKDSIRQLGIDSVDLICGGFPCQDLSVAGQRKGLAGERSGLWFEFLRVIKEFRPGWVVIENVPGLLSSNKGRDMGTLLNGLGQCGYWWAYRVLDSQFYGVPQRRRRVFIVASTRKFAPQEILFERDSSPWDTPPSREAGPEFAAAITERTRGADRNLELQNDLAYALTNPGSGGRPHSRLIAATLKSGGEGGIPSSRGENLVVWDNGQGDPNGEEGELSYTLNGQANQGICVQENGRNEMRVVNGDGQIAAALVSDFGVKQQNYVVGSQTAHHGRNNPDSQPFLITNAFNGYTGGADDNDAQGNHLVVSLADTLTGNGDTHSSFRDEKGLIVGPLQAHSTRHGHAMGTQQAAEEGQLVTDHKTGIRRLTPLECERLQAFPDGHTEIPVKDRKGRSKPLSDSARYRQLGNAVTVYVAEWIGKRIAQSAKA